jgi:hypothetical protein
MDGAVAVAEVQCLVDVGDDLDGPAWLDGAVVVQDVAQREPVDVFHHDVGQWTGGGLGGPGVEHRDDGGVVECGRVLRLAAESKIAIGVSGQVGPKQLDGDVAVQPDIAGEVNLCHPAEAEDFSQIVATGQASLGAHRNRGISRPRTRLFGRPRVGRRRRESTTRCR